MRNIIATLVVLLLAITLNDGPVLLAQPCGATQNCNPDHAYPYRFCSGGQITIRCSRNPNNEPGFTPYKVLNMPACAKRQPSSGAPSSSMMEDVDGNRFDVNLPTEWDDVINDGVDAWNCLCGHTTSNSSLNSCCLPVVWTDNPNDFGDATSILGVMQNAYFPDVCGVECVNGVLVTQPSGSPRIILNSTRNFTQFSEASGLG